MIVECTREHLLHVIENMRASDALSLYAAYGQMSCAEYARLRFESNGVKFALLKDGLPIGVGGVDDLGHDATLWMIATPAWYSRIKETYKAARRVIDACFDAGHTIVRAYVRDGFEPGCTMLEHLNFKRALILHREGKNGESYIEFVREKAHA